MATLRAVVTGNGGATSVEAPVNVRPPVVGFPVTEIRNHTFHGEVRPAQGARWSLREGVVLERAHLIIRDGAEVFLDPGGGFEMKGANPDEYVGGGATYDPAIHFNDFGVWLQHNGRLTMRGSPVESWNRTGENFKETDELWVAPTGRTFRSDGKKVINVTPSRWYPGMPIPRIHPRVSAEVMNTTRDVVIRGVGHIHDHSHIPQTWEWARLEGLGISNRASEGPVTGRYACHRHHGRGIPGTVWRGLVAVNSKGRVFVPHGIDGILIEDCGSLSSWGNALWWDVDTAEDASNDVLINRLCVMRVGWPRDVIGSTSRVAAVALVGGLRNEVRDSVVSGADGDGWTWPSAGDNEAQNIWIFDQGNVAHNCLISGVRFWNNAPNKHEVRNYFSYHNGRGIENGAYRNANYFEDCDLFEDAYFAQANGSRTRDGRMQTSLRVNTDTLTIGHIRLADTESNDWWQEHVECPYKVVHFNGDQRNVYHGKFLDCPHLTPDSISWPNPMTPALENSWVVIDGPLGNWVIRVKDQKVVVTEVAP